MIDLKKVTHTRAGYKVHNVRFYPSNIQYPIMADIEYEGNIEAETYTKDGLYYHTGLGDNTMDLVETKVEEEKIRHQVEEIDVISDCLESFAFSLSVVLTELDRIKVERSKE